MQLDQAEARAISEGLARIAPYYMPPEGLSEKQQDHIYCASKIGGVMLARISLRYQAMQQAARRRAAEVGAGAMVYDIRPDPAA